MRIELRGDNGRENTLAVLNDRGRRFIAGAFDAENPHSGCYSNVRVLVSDFDYHLPEELIAQEPLAERAASRMLVVHRSEGRWEDRVFRELPSFLQDGDMLVLNNTKVFPSRLYGWRSSGTAKIEVFLVRALDPHGRMWQALVRPGRKVPVEERIQFSDTLFADVIERGDHGLRTLRFEAEHDVFTELERCGHTPLPPYIRRADRPEDRERYNTVFASVRGSIAAPTAGLHFTPEMLEACRQAGAGIEYVTLHVGLGTFAPVHTDTVEDVRLHTEEYRIQASALEAIRSARRRIAVGTTSARTLETVYGTGELEGDTNLFIYPGYQFRAVDAMLTNFHLPKSSLVMLVSALAGRELMLDAYRHAVKEQYRFFSYGDCMLIL
jgi:S-adenosylmethionine:tRNA ribosyltransferase-isomerase